MTDYNTLPPNYQSPISPPDLGFECNRDGIFYFAPTGNYSLQIIKKRNGYKLGIYQRRWKGVYFHRHLFSCPDAAALYAFDFLQDFDKHREVDQACLLARLRKEPAA